MKKTIFLMALLLNGSTCFSIATDEMKGSIAILSTGVGEMEVSMLKNEDDKVEPPSTRILLNPFSRSLSKADLTFRKPSSAVSNFILSLIHI